MSALVARLEEAVHDAQSRGGDPELLVVELLDEWGLLEAEVREPSRPTHRTAPVLLPRRWASSAPGGSKGMSMPLLLLAARFLARLALAARASRSRVQWRMPGWP